MVKTRVDRPEGVDSRRAAKLTLIVGASLRERWRWARQHLYVILILSPLVGGMTYLTAARVASYAPADWQTTFALGLALSTLLSFVLVGLGLSRASSEIYHLREPEALFDALPVGASVHFHAALAARVVRTLVGGIVLLVVRALFETDAAATVFSVRTVAPLVVWIFLVALCEVFTALEWIHWGHTKDKRHAFAALLVLLPTLALAGLLLLLAFSDAQTTTEGSRALILSGGAVWSAALYALARGAHERWRARDIEYAKRLQAASLRRRSLLEAHVVGRVKSRAVAAQVARDLRLTLRAFSSAVYVASVVAALSAILLAVSLTTKLLPEGVLLPPGEGDVSWFETTWLLPLVATKVACVVAVTALVSLVPVLVAYQLPHLWLERAAGTTGAQLWEAKMLYARLVSLPAPLVVWAACVLCGGAPLFYALPLLAECLWLWWLVSTLTGSLAFEMADQPGLAIVLVLFAALSGGMLTAWVWPAGLAFYMFIPQAAERGSARARSYLTTEEI
jgi:hypothetical protein